MKRTLGYGRHLIEEDDVARVAEVLRSDFLTQGPTVERFERALADYVGAKYAVACANGTAALHLACLAANVTSTTTVATQTVTFVASANCVRYCGGDVRLVDIDFASLGMDPGCLAQALADDPAIEIVIPVHMGGLAWGVAEISRIAGSRIVIEDACHALGGTYEDETKVGSCRYSAMTCFSFHPVKVLTTGEGGAVTTNDPELFRRLRLLRNHGIEREPERIIDAAVGFEEGHRQPWYYEQQLLGFNYRLSDIQAALGLSQFEKLDRFVARRREIATRYDRAFSQMSHLQPLQAEPYQRQRSGHHLYIVSIDFEALGLSRREVMERLLTRRVGTQVHYIPVHRQPFHRASMAEGSNNFPAAEHYYSGCLSLPLHPALSDEEVEEVVDAVQAVVGR